MKNQILLKSILSIVVLTVAITASPVRATTISQFIDNSPEYNHYVSGTRTNIGPHTFDTNLGIATEAYIRLSSAYLGSPYDILVNGYNQMTMTWHPIVETYIGGGNPHFEIHFPDWMVGGLNLAGHASLDYWDGYGVNGHDHWTYDSTLFVTYTDPVPEPATMLLLGSGLVGLAGVRRKKIQKSNQTMANLP